MRHYKRYLSAASVVALVTAASLATPAAAQDASGVAAQTADDSSGGLQEIIVTAQKRTQRLSDVGISIVAQSGEQLRSAGITDVSDLAKVAPGFTAAPSQNGFSVFSIRGVNFNSNQVSASPTVSTYVDEAALPFPAMTGAMMLDVERVELLKGPQGTLFGQNATGGSINVIAAKPTSTFAAGMHGEVNHFGQVFLEGYLSGPLTDTLRARLSAQTTQFGEWQYSRYNSQKNGDQNKGAIRLLLDWQPTNAIKISLNVNASYDHGQPQSPQFVQWDFAFPPEFGGTTYPNYADQLPSDKIRVADLPSGFNPRNHNRQYQGVLRAEFNLNENLKLISISNYIDNKYNQTNNFVASFLPIDYASMSASAKSFGQELRINGTVPDLKLNYIIGGNYQADSPLRTRLTYDEVLYSALPAGTIIGNDVKESYKTTAVFANGDWEFVDGLTLTGGVRYTEVREKFSGCGALGNDLWAGTIGFLSATLRNLYGGRAPLPAGTFQAGGCTTLDDRGPLTQASFAPYVPNLSLKETNWSWRAGLNYKPNSDTLLYGLVSRGYKSGGFPAVVAPVATELTHVKQEELTSYEVGAKVALLDRKLQLELAGFYYDYRNKQLYTYIAAPLLGPVATAVNIPTSSVKGIDFSARANPLPGWTISGGVTYIKSKIKSVDPTTQTYDLKLDPAPILGKSFNFAPGWSGTADTEYRFAVATNMDAFVGGSLRFASTSYSDLVNSSVSRIPSFTVFDARLGVESHNGWKASIWARNLTNKLYLNNIINTGDSIARYTGMPRTFGMSFGVDF